MTHTQHITKIKQPKNNENNNISKKHNTFNYQPLARALSFFSFLNAPLFSPSLTQSSSSLLQLGWWGGSSRSHKRTDVARASLDRSIVNL